MKLYSNEPPREFEVGWGPKVIIKDCAKIDLSPNEQVTFITEAGGEYDLARKDWGFYATPSINGRLNQFNLRAVLTRNKVGQFYIMLVEKGFEDAFNKYTKEEELTVCGELNEHTLPKVEELLKPSKQ